MSTFISPARPKIVYPDSDGQPISDNTLQFKWIVTIERGLDALLIDDPDVFVAGDCFDPGEGPDNLKIIGPGGEPFLTYTELVKQRNADRERAEDQARLAEEQTQRADRLAARLRELGIEPD
jgi:hypothetical protein